MVDNQLELTEDQVQELLANGVVEEQEECDKITFDIDIIASMEEASQFNSEEFDKGVIEASKYIGQFSALINAGISSEYAIAMMEWMREDNLNKDNIKFQIKLAEIENIKLKKEIL